MAELTCAQCGRIYKSRHKTGRKFCSRACSNRSANEKAPERLAAKNSIAVWTCGGGVDSTAIACMICTGQIEKPDVALMVDVGYERDSTWRHVQRVLMPRLQEAEVTLNVLRTTDYIPNALLDRGGYVVIPAHRKLPDGKVSKLNTHCSIQWKARVSQQWLRAQGVERCETWIGIASEESRRARTSDRKWISLRYPLIERGMTREDCVFLLGEHGWPKAPRTSCYLCPNQTDREWRMMAKDEPHEFSRACQAERELQTTHPDVWMHRSCMPLAQWVASGSSRQEEDVAWASVLERHQPTIHDPLSRIEAHRQVCLDCDRMRGGRCTRFNGCSAFDAYLTALLFGRCPRFSDPTALVFDGQEGWLCVQ